MLCVGMLVVRVEGQCQPDVNVGEQHLLRRESRRSFARSSVRCPVHQCARAALRFATCLAPAPHLMARDSKRLPSHPPARRWCLPALRRHFELDRRFPCLHFRISTRAQQVRPTSVGGDQTRQFGHGIDAEVERGTGRRNHRGSALTSSSSSAAGGADPTSRPVAKNSSQLVCGHGRTKMPSGVLSSDTIPRKPSACAHSARDSTTLAGNTRFNGAAVFRLRKGRCLRPQTPDSYRFNGAAARASRKVQASID